MFAIRNLTTHTAHVLKPATQVRHFGPNPPVDLTKIPVGKIGVTAAALAAIAFGASSVKKEAPPKPSIK